jgi:putative ABC transport system permease protein
MRLSLLAGACVAVGTAGAVFILSVANGVLLRPPPFQDADRLVRIWAVASGTNNRGDVSWLESREVSSRVRSFDRLESATRTRLAVTAGDGTERVRGESVTPGYFDLITARPAHGRLFAASEYAPDAPRVVVIGHDLWQRMYGGRPDVVGQMLRARGTTGRESDRLFTIIGVMPPRFVGTVDPDLSEFWLPIAQYSPRAVIDSRMSRSTWVLARLRAGVSPAAAQDELRRARDELAVAHPAAYRDLGLELEPVGESWRSRFRDGLRLLVGTALLLLLIAAVNVGHLLVARLGQREQEMRVRLALGATRATLIRQLLVESAAIAIAGGVAGAAAAVAAVRYFGDSGLFPLPPYVSLDPDFRVIGGAIGVIALTAMLSGVFPAWIATQLDGTANARDGRGQTLGRRQGRSVQSLVVAEVAIAFVLLVGTGLMVRTYSNLLRVDVGFRTTQLLRLGISLDRSEFRTTASILAFADNARREIETVRGVERASVIAGVLPPWSSDAARLGRDGNPIPALGDVDRHAVDTGFFGVMGMRLALGRAFTPTDGPTSDRVAVVSRSLGRALFGDETRAVGRTFDVHEMMGMGGSPTSVRVVGIVEDVNYRGPLTRNGAQQDLFVPLAQAPDAVLSIAVATSVNPDLVRADAIRALGRFAPTSPVHWVSTMEEELRLQFNDARMYAWTTAVFGGSALVLVAIGIFGVLSNAVTRRFGEIGIRMAVGATPWRIRALVLLQAGRPIVTGLVIGGVIAVAATRTLRSLVYGITPTDPITIGAVAMSLLAIGFLASYLPARRATRIDPAVVLRRG